MKGIDLKVIAQTFGVVALVLGFIAHILGDPISIVLFIMGITSETLPVVPKVITALKL